MGRVRNNKDDGHFVCFARNGRLNGVFMAGRIRIRVSFLVACKWLYEFAKQNVKRSQKKAPDNRSSDQPIRARSQKTRNRIVQSDYSGRTNKSDGPIRALPTDHLPYPTNQILWSDFHTDHLLYPTNQILRSDFHTDQISVPTNQILWSNFHTDQISVPADQILQSDFHTDQISVPTNQIIRPDFHTDQISVPTNQILQTNLHTDQISVSTNQILRTDFPTDHLPYRPIKSLRVSPAEIIKKSDHSDSYQTVINGHGLRSHPQDWMVRPSSLSRLRAKAIPRTHKPPQAHKSLTRKAVLNHTQ